MKLLLINQNKMIKHYRKIIPDKYLDPILNTPLLTQLFTRSQVILNLDTIKKHLENNNDIHLIED